MLTVWMDDNPELRTKEICADRCGLSVSSIVKLINREHLPTHETALAVLNMIDKGHEFHKLPAYMEHPPVSESSVNKLANDIRRIRRKSKTADIFKVIELPNDGKTRAAVYDIIEKAIHDVSILVGNTKKSGVSTLSITLMCPTNEAHEKHTAI